MTVLEPAQRGNSQDRDGTRARFDCELTAAVSDAVDILVITSGSAGPFEHVAEGVLGRARGCGAGRLDLPLGRVERDRSQAIPARAGHPDAAGRHDVARHNGATAHKMMGRGTLSSVLVSDESERFHHRSSSGTSTPERLEDDSL
jgi:hypothetical protein